MAIYEYVTHFAGRPVADWEPETGIYDPENIIYRIGLTYEEGDDGVIWTDKFSDFLSDPNAQQVPGIVVGAWGDLSPLGDSGSVVEALVAARERLSNLEAIFLGDIISEEQEISWIQQTNISPLFTAYPGLKYLSVRGSEGLSLGSLKLPELKSLILQSGGLPAGVVREVAASDLPELEHLELWLGTDNYGGDARADDLKPILSGELFPKLQYLGLRDSEIADDIAHALLKAPVVERLRVLDLSLGTLGDEGAEALLENAALRKLELLDIHHHYCSDEMIVRLRKSGIKVDASEQQEAGVYNDETYRYVSVSE